MNLSSRIPRPPLLDDDDPAIAFRDYRPPVGLFHRSFVTRRDIDDARKRGASKAELERLCRAGGRTVAAKPVGYFK